MKYIHQTKNEHVCYVLHFYKLQQPQNYSQENKFEMTDTSISEFHTSFYIPEKKLAFHLPHLCILGTHYCGNKCHETFRHCGSFQNVLCNCDYIEQMVASFEHQIQSKCYDGNIFVSIEGIELNHFSDTKHTLPLSETQSCTHHAVFHSFFCDDRKKDAATIATHRKKSLNC